MTRGVLFDLDRTLLDRDTSIERFASSQHGRFESLAAEAPLRLYVETFVRLDARGHVPKDEVYRRLVAELGIRSVGWDVLFADFEARVSDFYLPFPHLHNTLRELSREGYRLGLVTNGRTAFQTRTISVLGIAEFFPAILISEAERMRKPDPEIFLRALHRLNLAPSEAAFVGDHPLADIAGARAVGMRAVWKRNTDFTDVSCDGAINDLSELPSLLRGLFEEGADRRTD